MRVERTITFKSSNNITAEQLNTYLTLNIADVVYSEGTFTTKLNATISDQTSKFKIIVNTAVVSKQRFDFDG